MQSSVHRKWTGHGSGVRSSPAHPNLKPQIAALLHQVLQICCRSATTAQDYAQLASLDRGVSGDDGVTMAQAAPVPLPKTGTCPLGYYSSAGYCVPTTRPNTREAIQKSGSTCPLGWYTSGSYCVRTP